MSAKLTSFMQLVMWCLTWSHYIWRRDCCTAWVLSSIARLQGWGNRGGSKMGLDFGGADCLPFPSLSSTCIFLSLISSPGPAHSSSSYLPQIQLRALWGRPLIGFSAFYDKIEAFAKQRLDIALGHGNKARTISKAHKHLANAQFTLHIQINRLHIIHIIIKLSAQVVFEVVCDYWSVQPTVMLTVHFCYL